MTPAQMELRFAPPVRTKQTKRPNPAAEMKRLQADIEKTKTVIISDEAELRAAVAKEDATRAKGGDRYADAVLARQLAAAGLEGSNMRLCELERRLDTLRLEALRATSRATVDEEDSDGD